MVYKEVYSKEEAKDLLLEGVNELANTVLLTMGPNGKTVIIANNDKQIGSIIKKAYEHSNVIRVEESDNSEDILDTVDGMELDGSYFSQAFINNAKKQAIEYDKCKFIIVEGKLETLDPIVKELKGAQEYPIIVMADHIHDEVISLMKRNYNSGALAIGFIKSPSFAQYRKDIVSDIISYTKASPLLNSSVYVAEIDGIFADKNKFILTKKNPNRDKIVDLKESIKSEISNHSKKLIQNRIDNLEGTLSIIKVGGGSEVEMKERKDRIDDAVLAVKSAMEEGIVEGGGVALLRNIIYLNEDLKSKLYFCLSKPYKTISKNDNSFILDESERKRDLMKEGIIDPHKVTRCAFQNAISVAKTFLSIEAVVLTPELW